MDTIQGKGKSTSKKRSHREDPEKEKEPKRPRVKEPQSAQKHEEKNENDVIPKTKADIKEKIEPVLRQPTPGQLQAQQVIKTLVR